MKTKQLFKSMKVATFLAALSMSFISCQEIVEAIYGSSIDNPVTAEPTSDTKPDTETNNLDIEKLIWDSIDIINQDGMIIEPKLVPFIPGDDPKILLNEN